jgi:hypothetical protein
MKYNGSQGIFFICNRNKMFSLYGQKFKTLLRYIKGPWYKKKRKEKKRREEKRREEKRREEKRREEKRREKKGACLVNLFKTIAELPKLTSK